MELESLPGCDSICSGLWGRRATPLVQAPLSQSSTAKRDQVRRRLTLCHHVQLLTLTERGTQRGHQKSFRGMSTPFQSLNVQRHVHLGSFSVPLILTSSFLDSGVYFYLHAGSSVRWERRPHRVAGADAAPCPHTPESLKGKAGRARRLATHPQVPLTAWVNLGMKPNCWGHQSSVDMGLTSQEG